MPRTGPVSRVRRQIATKIDNLTKSCPRQASDSREPSSPMSSSSSWICALCTKANPSEKIICMVCGRSKLYSANRKSANQEEVKEEGTGIRHKASNKTHNGPASIVNSPNLKRIIELFGKASMKSEADIKKCENLGHDIRATLQELREKSRV